MIDRTALLSDLQKVLQRLEADLLERSESADVPEVRKALRADYDQAKTAARTAQSYEEWRTDYITQMAAAWVLSCVFVRFLEDNELIDPPKIAGPDDRLARARDESELYFRNHPTQTDRDYLLAVFDQLARLPGTKDVFGEHNPIRELPNWLSGDAAGELLRFFQKIDANMGALVHDFTDINWDTRFLGDLYQDLSRAAREKYALLQTPEFVEEFILDRTLNPGLDEFGLDATPVLDNDGNPLTEAGFRMIDPACGSGHFLLGAFPRILDRWQRKEPGTNLRELVQRTLNSIHGVDVNPYAVAIARFRLLLAAMRVCGVTRLADAPGFRLKLACGDSLLHAPLRTGQQVFDFELTNGDTECEHAYQSEDLPVLKKILRVGQYHAVVANPPYIPAKDRQLNDRYRLRFRTCHGRYSLAVPFMEQIIRLAVAGGYTGQITTNAFMKREFGKKLIEEFLPTVDLTDVIDTSLAYIPGHGTPTIILFARHQTPVARTIRCVGGIKREDEEPVDPAQGLVWSAIVALIDQPGSQSEFVSVSDSPREAFHKYPWSIGGGGARELKEAVDGSGDYLLRDCVDVIGIFGMTNADEAMFAPKSVLRRQSIERAIMRPLLTGDQVRDWGTVHGDWSLFPYENGGLIDIVGLPFTERRLWPVRTVLGNRATFDRLTYFLEGRPWWEWHQVALDRLRVPLTIAYPCVATHNHFVLDRGNYVFNRHSPIIKLPGGATENDHLSLVGLLNCSTAGFWLRQTCHDKGGGGIGGGIAAEAWERFFEYTGTKLEEFPIPTASGASEKSAPAVTVSTPPTSATRLLDLARALDVRAQMRAEFAPATALCRGPTKSASLVSARVTWTEIGRQMITLQEELDWLCYRIYGLLDDDLCYSGEPLCLPLGHRAFELLLARKMAGGETQTTWFKRHGSTPITELPADLPDDYRRLVERRIALIESDPNIRLIEQPEYKRRWNTEPWDSQLERALSEWLLDRLESYFDIDGRLNDADQPTAKLDVSLVSVAKLADIARQDAEFLQVSELYRDDPAFDVQALVAELVAAECVPLLPVLRYKPSGIIKHGTWERTWDLQRQEDVIDAQTKLPSTDPDYLSEDTARDLKQEQVGDIPVPTKYDSKDFLDSNFWRLRGKLDVPKERWISFPHCEGPDGTPVIAWAGYNHLQQARAISAYYVRVQTEFGGSDDARLIPLLACLIELLPWLKQWHNDPDSAFDGMRMGDYFEGFVAEEARQLNKTNPEIKAWTPPARTGGRRRRTST